MKAAILRTKTISANTPDGLDAAVLAFTQTLQEETLLEFQYHVTGSADAPLYSVCIVYTG